MAKKIILTIIFLAAIATLVFWFIESRNDDNDNSESVSLSVAVFNQTQDTDGASVNARPNDILVYTLTASNTSDDVISGFVVETNISDVSELASLIDASGANYNAGNSSLMWTPLDIPAQNSITKQFSVRVKENIPAESDKVMSLSYNNEVSISVATPTVAGSEAPTPTPTPGSYEAPTTGPSIWFALVLGMIFTAGVVLYRTAKRMNA